MNILIEKIKSKRRVIIIITSSVASIVLFIQNIEFLADKVLKVTNPIQRNLTIVDQFFRGDTLDFRLINNGDKSIAIRQIEFVVENTWRIYDKGNSHFDFIEGSYDVLLPDSLKSYRTSMKVFESLKPNEINRFELILRGENAIPDTVIVGHPVMFTGGYFIQFHLEFLLNDTKMKKISKPFLHSFKINSEHELLTKSFVLEANNAYFNERFNINLQTAKKLSKMNLIKSEKANFLINNILKSEF